MRDEVGLVTAGAGRSFHVDDLVGAGALEQDPGADRVARRRPAHEHRGRAGAVTSGWSVGEGLARLQLGEGRRWHLQDPDGRQVERQTEPEGDLGGDHPVGRGEDGARRDLLLDPPAVYGGHVEGAEAQPERHRVVVDGEADVLGRLQGHVGRRRRGGDARLVHSGQGVGRPVQRLDPARVVVAAARQAVGDGLQRSLAQHVEERRRVGERPRRNCQPAAGCRRVSLDQLTSGQPPQGCVHAVQARSGAALWDRVVVGWRDLALGEGEADDLDEGPVGKVGVVGLGEAADVGDLSTVRQLQGADAGRPEPARTAGGERQPLARQHVPVEADRLDDQGASGRRDGVEAHLDHLGRQVDGPGAAVRAGTGHGCGRVLLADAAPHLERCPREADAGVQRPAERDRQPAPVGGCQGRGDHRRRHEVGRVRAGELVIPIVVPVLAYLGEQLGELVRVGWEDRGEPEHREVGEHAAVHG